MSSRKGCALLAYLIVKRQPQEREAVADLLWESTSTKQSLARLRVLLTRIQKQIPELIVTRTTLCFRPTADTAVDLYDLQENLLAGEADSLEQGLATIKGPLIENFYLEGTYRFNEWLIVERERLHLQTLDAFRQLTATYEKQNDTTKQINITKRWLESDLLNEEALRNLLRALTANGQHDTAIAQYERSRQQLLDELGVEPEKETTALYQQLLALKKAAVELPQSLPAQAAWPDDNQLSEPAFLPANSFIPYQRNNDFTGRKESLLKIANHLSLHSDPTKPFQRTMAITGMGGLGKTQLAVEYCYRYGRYYHGGIFWISFTDDENIVNELLEIGGERGLGLYNETTQLSKKDKLDRIKKAWQDPIPRLLIFDNCEEESLLSEWLPVTGGCRVLITSRRANWSNALQGVERQLSVLDQEESIDLMTKVVPKLTPDEALAIAETVGHLPLALHLASSFLKRYQQITAVQYLQQLENQGVFEHPSLKGRGAVYSPTGHELDVFHTFAVNLEQLDINDAIDQTARFLLACTAQFAPSEPIPRHLLLKMHQADDLMGQLLAEDAVTRLESLGFIRSNGQESLSVHRLITAFASRVLAETGEAHARVQFVVWETIKESWTQELALLKLPIQPKQLHHLANSSFDQENVYTARFAHAWAKHLIEGAKYSAAKTYLERAFAVLKKLGYTDRIDFANITNSLGTVYWRLGDIEAASEMYTKTNSMYEELLGQNDERTAKSISNLGILHHLKGEFEQAIDYYQKAINVFEKIPNLNPVLTSISMFNLGSILNAAGEYERARTLLEKTLTIRRERFPENNPYIISNLNSLADLYSNQGNYEQAFIFLDEAMEACHQQFGEEHETTAMVLSNYATTLIQVEAFAKAESYTNRALAIRKKLLPPEHPYTIQSTNTLGIIYLKTGRLDEAEAVFLQTIEHQLADNPDHAETAKNLNNLGNLYLKLNQGDKAKAYLDQALTLVQKNYKPSHPAVAHSLISMGDYFREVEAYQTASEYYSQSLEILETAVLPTHVDLARVKRKLRDI
ncbi:MAG: tetratricopeptide repeat protein [Chloroflexota bacterium]